MNRMQENCPGTHIYAIVFVLPVFFVLVVFASGLARLLVTRPDLVLPITLGCSTIAGAVFWGGKVSGENRTTAMCWSTYRSSRLATPRLGCVSFGPSCRRLLGSVGHFLGLGGLFGLLSLLRLLRLLGRCLLSLSGGCLGRMSA